MNYVSFSKFCAIFLITTCVFCDLQGNSVAVPPTGIAAPTSTAVRMLPSTSAAAASVQAPAAEAPVFVWGALAAAHAGTSYVAATETVP